MKKWLMIGVFALAAAGAGFIIYDLTHESTYTLSGPVALNSSVISDTQAATGPKPMATVLPEFSLQNRDGQKQSIRSWPGKSMIVNFWATWCAPCRKEIPLLKVIAKKEAPAGFQVVGIAIDFRDDVLKYANEIKIDYPLLIGEQDGLAAADSFGIQSAALPFTVFTDNQGRIVTLVVGELTERKAKVVLDDVKRVNKGELTPEAARADIATQFLKIPPATH